MAEKTKASKRDAILDAMLNIVVERGFHDAPMSLIKQRSGVSAGVIYHYFTSKEEIIQELHERVRTLKRSSLLEGYSPEMPAKDAFVLVWMNGYRFYREHVREMRFLEQYEAAGFSKGEDAAASVPRDARQIAFERRFRGRAKGGVLTDLPSEVIYELTFGVVARLARQPKKLSDKVLLETAHKVWEAVRARD